MRGTSRNELGAWEQDTTLAHGEGSPWDQTRCQFIRRLLWPICSDSSVWFSETPCVFISFPFFLRSLQRRAEKTISHKKATRYISSCLYEPLSLSIIDGEIQSRTHVSQWWTEMPGGQMMTPVTEWPGLSQARSLPLLTLTCMSRHPPLTDLSPGGSFFFFRFRMEFGQRGKRLV